LKGEKGGEAASPYSKERREKKKQHYPLILLSTKKEEAQIGESEVPGSSYQ